MPGRIEAFERHRPRLKRLAYRMLGSLSDAEDLLQDAYLRWHQADPDCIQNSEAWLVATVTRLAIDRLRLMQRRRASYYGQWLPEPWQDPDHAAARDEDLAFAFLVLLDLLKPEERAALVLREGFERDYAAIAAILGKSVAACQQLVSRARAKIRSRRELLDRDLDVHKPVIAALVSAMRAGDEKKVLSLLDGQATLVQDGGGKVLCAVNVVEGPTKCARLLARIGLKRPNRVYRLLAVNGGWGLAVFEDGALDHLLQIATSQGRILHLYGQFNPEKLGSITT